MRAEFDATGDLLVVTGGASGIGAALAREYSAHGGNVIVADIAPSAGLAGVERIEQVTVDVTDREAIGRVVAEIAHRYGGIDALVAGAAVQPRVAVMDMMPETWRHTLAVNLDGVLWACQAAVPHMPRGASIVVFGSGLARSGRAEASAYAATKGALVPFAKSLASELHPRGIRVNAVFPGVIDTPQFRKANPDNGERAHWADTTGIGSPDDVSGPLMYLLSDAATMTGSVLTRERAYHRGTPGEPANFEPEAMRERS